VELGGETEAQAGSSATGIGRTFLIFNGGRKRDSETSTGVASAKHTIMQSNPNKEIIMTRKAIFTLALLAAILVPALQIIHAATQSFEGVISDTMCGKKHMMPGSTDAQCIAECVKAGAKYALVVGDKVYTLDGKAQAIAPLAGKQVRITGEVKSNTINVTSIQKM
jgi:hypothetical protein